MANESAIRTRAAARPLGSHTRKRRRRSFGRVQLPAPEKKPVWKREREKKKGELLRTRENDILASFCPGPPCSNFKRKKLEGSTRHSFVEDKKKII